MAAAAAAVGWQRLAGVSGAAAVGLGAYGAHGLQGKDPTWKHIYDTASRYHLVHSAALLAAPHARRPHLAGALLSSGMALFCGTNYVVALQEDRTMNAAKAAPVGGLLLIAGWLAFAL